MKCLCTALYMWGRGGVVLTYKIGRQYFSLQILPSVVPPSPICCEYQEILTYESIATVGEIGVWWRANFQSGSRVLKKVF